MAVIHEKFREIVDHRLVVAGATVKVCCINPDY